MFRIFFILFFVVSSLVAQQKFSVPLKEKGQEEKDGLVHWFTFKEAQEFNKTNPKPFLIDVYTDWCGWCKHMIKTTYSDPGLANYINAYFYAIKFDAETKDTIEYNGEKFWNTGKGPKSPHQLAIKFLNGQLSYPSTIFVSNNFQFNLLSQGYLDVRKIEPLLIFTVENVFRTTAYEEFANYFNKTFIDTSGLSYPVKTHSIQEALELQKKNPKKILIDIYTNFCNSCKVMNKTTFQDSALARYINENYYLVDFNAEQKGEIEFKGKKYVFGSEPNFPFHPLTIPLTRRNIILPSVCVLDESLEIIDVLTFYVSPKKLDPILVFFAGNYFKTIPWPDFQKKWLEGSIKK
jgi:thioredoxin-related protein